MEDSDAENSDVENSGVENSDVEDSSGVENSDTVLSEADPAEANPEYALIGGDGDDDLSEAQYVSHNENYVEYGCADTKFS